MQDKSNLRNNTISFVINGRNLPSPVVLAEQGHPQHKIKTMSIVEYRARGSMHLRSTLIVLLNLAWNWTQGDTTSTKLLRVSSACRHKPKCHVVMMDTVIRQMWPYIVHSTRWKEALHFTVLYFCALVTYFTARWAKFNIWTGERNMHYLEDKSDR